MKNIVDATFVFVLFFVGGTACCVDRPKSVPVPQYNETINEKVLSTDEMQNVDVGFCRFSLPTNMKKLNAKGIDTLVARFDGPKFTVDAEYGALVDPEPRRLNFFDYSESASDNIDGRVVKLYSYKSQKNIEDRAEFKTVVGYFENPRKDGGNLLIEIDCLPGSDCEPEATNIIQSVRFDP